MAVEKQPSLEPHVHFFSRARKAVHAAGLGEASG